MNFSKEILVVKRDKTTCTKDGLLFISVKSSSHTNKVVEIALNFIGQDVVNVKLNFGNKYTLKTENDLIYEIQLIEFTEWNSHPRFSIISYNPSELWDRLSETQNYFSFGVETDENNDPITEDEQTVLNEKLNLLRVTMIKDYATTEEQNDIINEKLDYIIETMKRQGKLDWVHTSIGVLATIAVSIGISVEQAKDYWQTIKNILGSTLKLISVTPN